MAGNWNMFNRPLRAMTTIAPSDTVNLPRLTRQIVVTTAGDLKVDMAVNGHIRTVTLQSVPAGTIDLAATRVYATGTTASGLTGVY